MRSPRFAQFQRCRHPFEGDSIHPAVVFLDERPGALRIAATAGPAQEQVMAHKGIVSRFAAFSGMNDENLFHAGHPIY